MFVRVDSVPMSKEEKTKKKVSIIVGEVRNYPRI
jgi:hypothetical protein